MISPLSSWLTASLLCTSAPAATGDQDVWTEETLARVSAEVSRDVERIRGMKFRRPVTMKITDKAGFIAHAKERMAAMVTPELLAGNELMAKLLGLIPADLDLMEKTFAVLEEQVGGFYVPDEDTFYIMESFVGPAAKIILAHELTHALDDQYYDIDDDMKALVTESDAGSAYSAVVEGSGTLAMNRYTMENLASLDPKALQEVGSVGSESMKDAPAFIWLPLLTSYLRGSTFLLRSTSQLEAQTRDASSADLQQAFTRPPRSTEQVLHPEKYWDAERRDDPIEVRFDTMSLPEGWSVAHQDTLGELLLALLVTPGSSRAGLDASNPMAVLGLKYTNPAAEGWGGDRLVILAKGDGRILRLVSVWDSERDAAEFYGALTVLTASIQDNLKVLEKVSGVSRSSLDIAYGASPLEVVATATLGVRNSRVEEVLERLTYETRKP